MKDESLTMIIVLRGSHAVIMIPLTDPLFASITRMDRCEGGEEGGACI